VHIDTESFLLPSFAETQLTGIAGGTSVNRTRFNSCRHYTGESILVFDDPDPQLHPVPAVSRTLQAPAGVTIDLALESSIKVTEAAVGDPVEAALSRSAKIVDGIVAPKGARVRGRITHVGRNVLQRFHGYTIGMDISEISWPGTDVQIRAVLEAIPSPLRNFALPDGLNARRKTDEHGKIMGSIFFVRSNSPVTLSKGFRMTWRTLEAEAEDRQ
jgi:hypothetical protein